MIGMPRVGKSTLFKAMSEQAIAAEDITHQTTKAVVGVDNPDLDWLFQSYQAQGKICAPIYVIETPGLVRGARFGMGAGNGFLEEIREADGMFHVLRAFENDVVSHVDGELDTVRDLECVNQELINKDCQIMCTKIQDIEDALEKRNNKKIKPELERHTQKMKSELDLCLKALSHLRAGKEIRLVSWTDYEIQTLQTYSLLTAKPMIYLVNISEQDFKNRGNILLGKVSKWSKENTRERVVPFSCDFFSMPEHENAIKTMRRIINVGFEACHIIKFFTANAIEVTCWLIREGTNAHELVGSVHGDFRSIKVIKLTDLKESGSEAAVQASGGQIVMYMTYVIQDGDVISFQS